jgi:hypothetical protein
VGARWNPIVLELREWLKFGEEVKKEALAEKVAVSA